jgi:hypothetical protein
MLLGSFHCGDEWGIVGVENTQLGEHRLQHVVNSLAPLSVAHGQVELALDFPANASASSPCASSVPRANRHPGTAAAAPLRGSKS